MMLTWRCMLAKLKSETAAAGKTGLLKTGKPAATWRAEETLKYDVWIEVYKYTQM